MVLFFTDTFKSYFYKMHGKKIYIDDISIPVSEQKPIVLVDRKVIVNNSVFENRNDHGTVIEISNLKGEWSFEKIKKVNAESQKLESIFEKIFSEKKKEDFVVPKGYKLVQEFNEETAKNICNVVNIQLEKAYKWLEKFKKAHK